jgi:hypothetical protein
VTGLPRTNNALEHSFGSLRYHERRASWREAASPSRVINGSVRLPAALFTRAQTVTVEMLAAVPHGRWRAAHLRYRFRKHPAAYLEQLEKAADKLNLRS